MTKRTDDYDEIVRVMRLYIDGFNDKDTNKFREAFDANAWIYYIDDDGSLHKNPFPTTSRSGLPQVGASRVGSFQLRR
jgi:hypothetical protein